VCDSDGCDYNSYRNGNTAFLGPAGTINTATKFTVVTQFITNDNTATGNLVEIRRSYIQNGVVIQNSVVNVPGLSAYSSMTNAYCAAQKSIFQNANTFTTDGGLQQLGTAMARGMVLAISIWDDQLPGSDLNWLDSNYPATGNPSTPGVARGPCSTTVGVPQTVEAQSAGASVIFSNFKYGPIGSTTPPPPPPPPVAHFGQCGGIG
jgi:cellulose 1,4-beta-cellobiosidase